MSTSSSAVKGNSLIVEITLKWFQDRSVRFPVGGELRAVEAVLLSEALERSFHLQTLLEGVERLGQFDVRRDSPAAVNATPVIGQLTSCLAGR